MKRIFSEARDLFITALGELRSQLEKSRSPDLKIEIEHIVLDFIDDNPKLPVQAELSERLCTDLAFLRLRSKAAPHSPNPMPAAIENRKICFVTSGIHGIEGYAGSALQSLLLGQINLLKSILATTDLCFIHAANPWGMHHFERTDQHNIDLNRNCHTDAGRYNQKNTPLTALRALTAPKKPLRWRSFERLPLSRLSFHFDSVRSIQFYTRLVGLFLRKGIKASTLAVVNGQYEYPDEIFYGGKELNAHLKSLRQILVDNLCTNAKDRKGTERDAANHSSVNQLNNYEQCTVIDIHTGLGSKGSLTLLLDEQSLLNTADWKAKLSAFKTQYEDRSWPVTPGIFSEWLCELALPQKAHQHAAIVFEVGTLGNGSVASNLEPLKRMVEANQLRHFGTYGDQDLAFTGEQAIRSRFRALFLPEDRDWERTVVTHRFQDLQNLITVIADQR
jgi:hypothetical protein